MFPGSGHPDAIAYVPPDYSGAATVDLVIFVHGWRGCAEVIINDEEAPCHPGGEVTHAYHLADALASSGKDAVLLVLEGPYDQCSVDDGALVQQGRFAALVGEALGALTKAAGDPPDAPPLALGQIQLVAHSGAVKAVADILDHGGLDDHLAEVDLLDTLYGSADSFARWFDTQALAAAADAIPRRRVVVLYTNDSGAEGLSRQLESRPLPAAAAMADKPDDPIKLTERVAPALSDTELAAPILFGQTFVDHSALPLVYFPQLLATGPLRSSSDTQPR
jgi:hypothetical protein